LKGQHPHIAPMQYKLNKPKTLSLISFSYTRQFTSLAIDEIRLWRERDSAMRGSRLVRLSPGLQPSPQ
jgi:hypothetical protein